MNVRQSTLLRSLLDIEHFTPVAEFARMLGCSEKTVRTDVQAVNEHLERGGFASRVGSKRGNGIRMVLVHREKGRIEALVADTSIESRPRLERFLHGVLLVTCSPRSYTVDSLARALFTNKQQLQHDMKWWALLMKPFELSMKRQGSLAIEGSEVALRFFIIYSFFKLDARMVKNYIDPMYAREDTLFLDRIADEAISAKLDRMEQVSGRIFKLIEEDEAKRDAAGTFLNYYLPTTLKLLENYASFEEAGVSGENLSQAKAKIEKTMDSIVAGFEHQLDELYRTDAMDIDSDIRVMETMLRRDTASVADDFGLNGSSAVQQRDE